MSVGKYQDFSGDNQGIHTLAVTDHDHMHVGTHQVCMPP